MARAAPSQTSWSAGSTGRGPSARRAWLPGTTARRWCTGSATPTASGAAAGTQDAARCSSPSAVAPVRAAAASASTTSRRWGAVGLQREHGAVTVLVQPGPRLGRPPEDGAQVGWTDGRGPSFPLPRQVRVGDARRLVRPGGRPGHASGPGRVSTDLMQPAPDVGGPGRELAQERRREAGDLGLPRGIRPTDAERVRQCRAQVGLVEGGGGLSMGIEAAPVARTPAPVGPVHQVGHHGVRVQVRVAVAVHPVREESGRRARCGQDDAVLTRAAPGGDPVRLQVGQRARDGLDVAGDHCRAVSGPPRA